MVFPFLFFPIVHFVVCYLWLMRLNAAFNLLLMLKRAALFLFMMYWYLSTLTCSERLLSQNPSLSLAIHAFSYHAPQEKMATVNTYDCRSLHICCHPSNRYNDLNNSTLLAVSRGHNPSMTNIALNKFQKLCLSDLCLNPVV